MDEADSKATVSRDDLNDRDWYLPEDIESETGTASSTSHPSSGEWAADAMSPDYRHIGRPGQSSSFELTGNTLLKLARLNRFNVSSGQDEVLFGLRGCRLINGTSTAFVDTVQLSEDVPDHRGLHCVLGIWRQSSNEVAVYAGSTVPNWVQMQSQRRRGGRRANMLLTGFYEYTVGVHRGRHVNVIGAFRLQNNVIVLRSNDDLKYEVTDFFELHTPADNIHPAFSPPGADFSSAGCQTIPGRFANNTHYGAWASFRNSAGLAADPQSGMGNKYRYMLLTGREARLVANDDENIPRLRFGSSGSDVAALQQGLRRAGIYTGAIDSEIGGATSLAFINWQQNEDNQKADGIVTPELGEQLGFDMIKQRTVVASSEQAINANELDPILTGILTAAIPAIVSSAAPALISAVPKLLNLSPDKSNTNQPPPIKKPLVDDGKKSITEKDLADIVRKIVSDILNKDTLQQKNKGRSLPQLGVYDIENNIEYIRKTEATIKKVSGDQDAKLRFQQGIQFTEVFPYSATCQMQIRMERAAGIGTAFYIDEYILLTAAHNIEHGKHGEMFFAQIYPGKSIRKGQPYNPYGMFKVNRSNVLVHPDYVPSRGNEFDIAVVLTPNRCPRGMYFQLGVATDKEIREGLPVAVNGYAADTSAGVDPNMQNLDYDIIRHENTDQLMYSLHTAGGTSGSPVWTFDPVHEVVGVHSAKYDKTRNVACRLDTNKISWIDNAKNILLEKRRHATNRIRIKTADRR